MFGQSYSCARTPALPVQLIAEKVCRAVFLDYQRMITFCSLACDFHTRLIQNLLRILAEANVGFENRGRHMSRRTTREKLLSYLSQQACSGAAGPLKSPITARSWRIIWGWTAVLCPVSWGG